MVVEVEVEGAGDADVEEQAIWKAMDEGGASVDEEEEGAEEEEREEKRGSRE